MKTLNKIILFLYIISLYPFGLYTFVSLFLLVPLYYIKKDKHQFYYLLYLFLTHILGTYFAFYHLPYYDKAMHFLSGCLIVILSYQYFKNKTHQRILYLLINTIEISISFLWEVFEYSGYIFLKYDAMHLSEGIHDTMGDMLISLIGGLIVSFFIYRFPLYIDNLCK